MSLAGIITAVAGLVTTGSGVVNVHNGVRWADQESVFRTLLRDATNGRIHCWFVNRRGETEAVTGTNNLTIIEHSVRVEGFYAVDDPGSGTSMTSEVAFRSVHESVLLKLRTSWTLSGSAMNSKVRVAEEGHRVLRGVLCHYIEIEVLAQERTSYV